MRLILYGTEADTSELTRMIPSIPELCYRHIRIEDYSTRDSFLTGLGAQSYRLGCAYFHKKPLSPEILSAAIAKCV